MTAGIPGSGIGGCFYVLSALLMPVQESVAIYRKTSSRASRKTVVRQILNSIGVLCGVWSTGWFISRSASVVLASVNPHQARVLTAMNWINMVYGMITLLAVFLIVQVLSVVMRGNRSV
jgi:fucose permease